jgi:hypothetical protein
MSASGKVPLKYWVRDEAARLGISASAIYARVARGKYPALKLQRENKRVVYVLPGSSIEPTLAQAMDYAGDLVADCWCDRVIIALAREVARLSPAAPCLAGDEEFPCTECGADAYLGMSDWRDSDGSQIIGKHERLCLRCSSKRGIGSPFRVNNQMSNSGA